jgi:hypothetical protein
MPVERCCPGGRGDNIIHLRRLHSFHPSNKEFKRMIAFVSGELIMNAVMFTTYHFTDASNSPQNLCLIVYRVPPNFTATLKSHGNSKANTQHHPT